MNPADTEFLLDLRKTAQERLAHARHTMNIARGINRQTFLDARRQFLLWQIENIKIEELLKDSLH